MDIQRRDIQQLTLVITRHTKEVQHLTAAVARAAAALEEFNKNAKNEEPK